MAAARLAAPNRVVRDAARAQAARQAIRLDAGRQAVAAYRDRVADEYAARVADPEEEVRRPPAKPKEHKILNPATGKYVLARGSIGKRLLVAALAGAALPPLQAPAGAHALTYRSLRTWTNNALRREEFESAPQALGAGSIEGAAKAIFAQLRKHGAAAQGAIVWFHPSHRDANPDPIARTIRGKSWQAVATELEMIMAGITTAGSDPYDFREYFPDLTRFTVKYTVPQAAGAGASYGIRHTPMFKLADYKGKEGDCLLSLLRAVSPKKLPERNEAVRHRFGLPPAPAPIPCDSATLVPLAAFFEVNVEVYAESITIAYRFEDRCQCGNRSLSTYTHDLILKTPASYARTALVLLEKPTAERATAHYAHILEMKALKLCPITGDLLEGKPRSQAALIARVREQGRTWRNGGKKDKKPRKWLERVLVFDCETIWDPDTADKLRPYSVGWFTFDPEKEFVGGDFGEVPIERVKQAEGLDTCMDELIKEIQDAPPNVRYTIVSFNGSNFDNFLLARAALRADCLTNALYTGHALRDVQIMRHSSLDLIRLLSPNTSLKAACAGFACKPTKVEGHDHAEIQAAFIAGGFGKWMDEHREKAAEYLARDVLSTCSLYQKLLPAITELTGVKAGTPKTKTIGGVAWEAMKEKLELPPAAASEELDKFLRRGITGGRTEVYDAPEGGRHAVMASGPLRMVDAKSLYPTVMYGKNGGMMPAALLYGQYPRGAPIKTERYVPDRVGFYNVRIKSQPKVPVLPKRDEDSAKPLDWKFAGEFDAVATQADIELIRLNGGQVDVGSGFYWEDNTKTMFNAYLEKLFAAKDEQDRFKKAGDPRYNPALREVAKILMNAASGKLAQRNYDELNILAKGSSKQFAALAKMQPDSVEWVVLGGEMCLLKGKKLAPDIYKQARAKPAYLAALIYSYARAYMYVLLLSRYHVLYQDTDSALMGKEDYDRFRADFPLLDPEHEGHGPAALGDFEQELPECPDGRAILVAPKNYIVMPVGADGAPCWGKSPKQHLKGVRLGRDILLDGLPEGAKPYEEMSTEELFAVYDAAGPARDPMAPFERLASDGKIRVLCSQIERKIDDEGPHMRQRFLVKEVHGAAAPPEAPAEPEAEEDDD